MGRTILRSLEGPCASDFCTAVCWGSRGPRSKHSPSNICTRKPLHRYWIHGLQAPPLPVLLSGWPSESLLLPCPVDGPLPQRVLLQEALPPWPRGHVTIHPDLCLDAHRTDALGCILQAKAAPTRSPAQAWGPVPPLFTCCETAGGWLAVLQSSQCREVSRTSQLRVYESSECSVHI